MKPRVVLFDPVRGNWLRFESPCRILTTRRMADVLPILRRVEAAVEQEGLHAAGFLSYEAAPALDPSLPSNGACGFPLLWFGLFRQVKEQDKLARKDAEAELPAHWRPSVTADAYMRALRAIRRHIREGDAYQVNYTYRGISFTRCPVRAICRLRRFLTPGSGRFVAHRPSCSCGWTANGSNRAP